MTFTIPKDELERLKKAGKVKKTTPGKKEARVTTTEELLAQAIIKVADGMDKTNGGIEKVAAIGKTIEELTKEIKNRPDKSIDTEKVLGVLSGINETIALLSKLIAEQKLTKPNNWQMEVTERDINGYIKTIALNRTNSNQSVN